MDATQVEIITLVRSGLQLSQHALRVGEGTDIDTLRKSKVVETNTLAVGEEINRFLCYFYLVFTFSNVISIKQR